MKKLFASLLSLLAMVQFAVPAFAATAPVRYSEPKVIEGTLPDDGTPEAELGVEATNMTLATLPEAVNGISVTGVTFKVGDVPKEASEIAAGDSVTATIAYAGTATAAGTITYALSGGTAVYSTAAPVVVTKGQSVSGTADVTFTAIDEPFTLTASNVYAATAQTALDALDAFVAAGITLENGFANYAEENMTLKIAELATAFMGQQEGLTGYAITAASTEEYTIIGANSAGSWTGKFTATLDSDTATDSNARTLGITVGTIPLDPTADVAFGASVGTLTVDTEDDTKIAVDLPAGTATVDITAALAAGQTMAKSGTNADKVTLDGSKITVNTDSIKGNAGGVLTFDITVSEENKTAITYTFTVTVAAAAQFALSVVASPVTEPVEGVKVDNVTISPGAGDVYAGTQVTATIAYSGTPTASGNITLGLEGVADEEVVPVTKDMPISGGATVNVTFDMPAADFVVEPTIKFTQAHLALAALGTIGNLTITANTTAAAEKALKEAAGAALAGADYASFEVTLAGTYSVADKKWTGKITVAQGDDTATDSTDREVNFTYNQLKSLDILGTQVVVIQGTAAGTATVEYLLNPKDVSNADVGIVPGNTKLIKVNGTPSKVDGKFFNQDGTENSSGEYVKYTLEIEAVKASVAGTTYLAVTAKDNNLTDTIPVLVTSPVTAVSIKERAPSVKVGATITITPKVTGGVVDEYTLKFYSDADCTAELVSDSIVTRAAAFDGTKFTTAANGATTGIYAQLTAKGYDTASVATPVKSAAWKITIGTASVASVSITGAPTSTYRQVDENNNFVPTTFNLEANWLPAFTADQLGLVSTGDNADKVEWTFKGLAVDYDKTTATSTFGEKLSFTLKPGATGTVQVTAKFKGKSVTHKMAVMNPPAGYAISGTGVANGRVEIATGKTVTLKATASTAFPKATYQWMSRNPSVATVASNGKVTGVSVGTTEVYLVADGKEFASVDVTVVHQLTGIAFAQSAATVENTGTPATTEPAAPEVPMALNLATDSIFKVVASYASPKATVNVTPADVVFTSNKNQVVVDNTAKTITVDVGYTGTAKITASFGGKSASFNLTIVKEGDRGFINTFAANSPLTGTLLVNKSATLKLTVAGTVNANGTGGVSKKINTNAVWTSSHPDIISVTSGGKITALKASASTVTITATPIGQLGASTPAPVSFSYKAVAPASKVALFNLNNISTKAITKLTISNLDPEYAAGDAYDDLSLAITGGAASNDVVWASSDDTIVDVVGNGNGSAAKLVWKASSTGVKSPKNAVKITATTGGKTATLTVTSKDYASDAYVPTMTGSNTLNVKVNGKLDLTDPSVLVLTDEQGNAATFVDGNITWKTTYSSPKGAISISKGVITGKKAGWVELEGTIEGSDTPVYVTVNVIDKNVALPTAADIFLTAQGGNKTAVTLPSSGNEVNVFVHYPVPLRYSIADALQVKMFDGDDEVTADALEMGVDFYNEGYRVGSTIAVAVITLKYTGDTSDEWTLEVTDTFANAVATIDVNLVALAPAADVVSATAEGTTLGDLRFGDVAHLSYTLYTGSGNTTLAADQRVSWEVQDDGGTEISIDPPVRVSADGTVTVLRGFADPFKIVGTPVSANSANTTVLQTTLTWTANSTYVGADYAEFGVGLNPTSAGADYFDIYGETLVMGTNVESGLNIMYAFPETYSYSYVNGPLPSTDRTGYTGAITYGGTKDVVKAEFVKNDGSPADDGSDGILKITALKAGKASVKVKVMLDIYNSETNTWGTQEVEHVINVQAGVQAKTDASAMQIKFGKLLAASYKLPLGKAASFSVVYDPTKVANSSVTWAIEDEKGYDGNGAADNSVATVDAKGKVTPVGAGTATLVATNVATGKTATCTIEVYGAITKVAAASKNYTISPKDTGIFADVVVSSGSVVTEELTSLSGEDDDATGRYAKIEFSSSKPEFVLLKAVTSSDEPAATAVGEYYAKDINAALNHVELVPRALGKSTITAENKTTGKKVTFTVTVAAPATVVGTTSVTMAKDAYDVVPGKTVTPKATVAPKNTTNKALRWSIDGIGNFTSSSSADEFEEITIDPLTGKVTASKNVIYAEVTVRAVEPFSGKFDDTTVYVRTAPGKITLTANEDYAAVANAEYNLPIVTANSEAAQVNLYYNPVTWTSSDPSVADVNGNGKIEATGKTGIVTFTAKTYNNKSAKIVIDFAQAALTGIVKAASANEYTSLILGDTTKDTARLEIAAENPGATVRNITWASDNEDAVTVGTGTGASATVTAVGAGEATITATYAGDSENPVTFNVRVVSVEVDTDTVSLLPGESETVTVTTNDGLSSTGNLTVETTSPSTSVATVDTDFKVTAVGAGSTTVGYTVAFPAVSSYPYVEYAGTVAVAVSEAPTKYTYSIADGDGPLVADSEGKYTLLTGTDYTVTLKASYTEGEGAGAADVETLLPKDISFTAATDFVTFTPVAGKTGVYTLKALKEGGDLTVTVKSAIVALAVEATIKLITNNPALTGIMVEDVVLGKAPKVTTSDVALKVKPVPETAKLPEDATYTWAIGEGDTVLQELSPGPADTQTVEVLAGDEFATGTTTVTVSLPSGGEVPFTATANVKVVELKQDTTTGSVLVDGKSLDLAKELEIAPAGTALKWSSAAADTAAVSNTGVVTAVKAGSATITASVDGNDAMKADFTITVLDAPTVTVSGSPVSLNYADLADGYDLNELYTFTPAQDADDYTFTWAAAASPVEPNSFTLADGKLTFDKPEKTDTATYTLSVTKTDGGAPVTVTTPDVVVGIVVEDSDDAAAPLNALLTTASIESNPTSVEAVTTAIVAAAQALVADTSFTVTAKASDPTPRWDDTDRKWTGVLTVTKGSDIKNSAALIVAVA